MPQKENMLSLSFAILEIHLVVHLFVIIMPPKRWLLHHHSCLLPTGQELKVQHDTSHMAHHISYILGDLKVRGVHYSLHITHYTSHMTHQTSRNLSNTTYTYITSLKNKGKGSTMQVSQ